MVQANNVKRALVRLVASFVLAASTAAKSLQSRPTLCDPIDGGPPGSPVPGILQARTLEGVAISFSNTWKWKVKVKSLSRVWLLATPWTAAYHAPPSMGFSRQEYWSGVPLPSPSFVLKRCNVCVSNQWGDDPKVGDGCYIWAKENTGIRLQNSYKYIVHPLKLKYA